MKTVKIIAYCLVAIVLFTAVHFAYDWLNPKPPVTVAAVPVSIKQDIIKTYKDTLTKQNHTLFTAKTANLPSSALTNGVISRPLLDSVKQSIGIKESQITNYMKVSIESTGKALKAEKRADSLQRIIYSYQSKYIDISFKSPDSLHKTGEFGYKYRSQIQAIQYSPKKFLGIPIGRDVIDISSTDTSAVINGLSAFSIRPDDSFFGAELQALATYNIFNKTISPGLGFQLRFGRVYLTGGEYYNTTTKHYNTLAGTRVSLFKY